jgi:hypothetical protein
MKMTKAKTGKTAAPANQKVAAIMPVTNVGDEPNEDLSGPETSTDQTDDQVSDIVIDRLELVRELPEIAADVEAVQVKGGIEHFKDVDRRTMNVVAYGGQLCKQAAE